MTGPQFAAIRKRLGLTAYDFGQALGYEGSRNAIQVQIAGMERGDRAITPQVDRLATMFDRFGVPAEFLRD